MTGVETHHIQRVFNDISFEAVERLDGRYKERAKIGLAEWTEEWHVAASGTINSPNDLVAANVDIEFSMDFFEAPEQRLSDLTMPTFSFGSYQTGTFVVFTAAVVAWARREDSAFIGATVRIGVHSPAAAVGTIFNGIVHLTFSGWGAPHDAEIGESSG